MWGDPWAEASWLTRIGRVLSHGSMWVIGVPFMWAALVMTSFFATAIFLTFYDEKAPVEQYLGRGFDGGVGDWIIGGSLLLSILLTTFAVWGKEATRESEIRRLRGLSCTDLVKAHDAWRAEQARLAEARRRHCEAVERWSGDSKPTISPAGSVRRRRKRCTGRDSNSTSSTTSPNESRGAVDNAVAQGGVRARRGPSTTGGATGREASVMTDEPEELPPLRRVTNLATGEVFWQRSWEFERLRAEILYAPMNGTLRSWLKRVWFNASWRWNRDPWVRWSAERPAKKPASSGLNSREESTTKEELE